LLDVVEFFVADFCLLLLLRVGRSF